jgi:RNA polymerase sigma factor (sigma-70 family)
MLHSYDTSVDAPSPSRGELFLQRYNRLLDWAMKLTNQRRAAAEDLVHDAFVQFMLCRLEGVNNLDGYLYGMLRKMRISQLRRSAQQINKMYHLRIADYDSAEGGLEAVLRAESHAADSRLQIQDELQRICQYVCARKETSKSASILILRFFLGYFPREIAKILRCQDRAVRDLLMTARREVKVYLNSPEQLKFIAANNPGNSNGHNRQKHYEGLKAGSTGSLLHDLRYTIFRSRQHECLTEAQIQNFYDDSTPANSLDCGTLAHVVSCIGCLEQINRLLDLPPLFDRFPTDMLGPDSKRNGPDDGNGSASGSFNGGHAQGMSGPPNPTAVSRQRLRQAFEHRPQELSVSVNGFIIGSLKVNGETSELILNRNADEPVEFIEVFSEQGIRLLFFEPSPVGAARQVNGVELSDGRRLQIDFDPGVLWSSFQVGYYDPELRVAEEPAQLKLVEKPAAKQVAVNNNSEPQRVPAKRNQALPARKALPRAANSKVAGKRFDFDELLQTLALPIRLLFSARLWAYPGRVTTFIISLIAIALLIHSQFAPAISAAGILAQANTTEQKINSNPGVVQHRILDLEERRPGDGRVISRRRIEDYRSGARAVKVRRLYDEQNRLIAGEWRKANGTRTLYGRDESPKSSSPLTAQSLTLDDVWQIDLSAKEFAALIKTDAATIEETKSTYVITYQPHASNSTQSITARAELINAAITLSKPDLYPVAQTLLVRQGSEIREFGFKEASYEQLPVIRVSPDKFELESEFINNARVQGRPGEVAAAAPAPAPEPLLAVMATPDLEVEVIRLLDQVNGFSGIQLSVNRTSKGYLEVEGVMDTVERKLELLQALGPVSNHPAVKIRIETATEAQMRLAAQGPSASVNQSKVGEVRFTNKIPPAYPELRRYLIERGAANDRINDATDKFTDTALGRSRRIFQHARAMKQIAARFTPEQLNSLDEKSLNQWRTLIRDHARDFQNEVTTLRRELEPIFLPPNFGNETQTADAELTSNTELVNAVGRLFDIWSGVDGGVRSSFTISTADPAIIEVKLPQFWLSLKNAESLSAVIKNSFPASHR